MRGVSDHRMIPIARVNLSEREIAAAVGVLRSGKLRQGAVTAEFECRFAAATGAAHAVAVSSGTAALHLAWLALLNPGDEVLVPAFTFVATATTVLLAGGCPILCDVDPVTFTIDVEDARRRLTPRTVAIAPVHLYGQACDVAALQRLAEDARLRIVWDAAQAHGTTYRGLDVGSLGDLVCYSFYPTKNMTTGEGGMITTDDDQLDRKLRLLRSHGQERKYYHTIVGLNYRMTDVQSAIGLVQLERLPDLLRRRRANARRLSELLSCVAGIVPPTELAGTEHAYHQYTVVVDGGQDRSARDRVASKLLDRGVETAVHYPHPLHEQPVLRQEGERPHLPICERLSQTVLSLPVHPDLSPEDVETIGRAVEQSLRAD